MCTTLIPAYTGPEVEDTVRIGGLTISQQRIGDAVASSGFQEVDGILGWVKFAAHGVTVVC